MKTINIELNDDMYHDFIDLLENCMFSEFPSINGTIAEQFLKQLEEDE